MGFLETFSYRRFANRVCLGRWKLRVQQASGTVRVGLYAEIMGTKIRQSQPLHLPSKNCMGNDSAKVHTTSTVLMTRRRVIAASSLAAYLATILQSHMLTTKILMTCYAKVIRGISIGLIPVWLNWDLSARTHCSYAQHRRCDDDVMLGCAYLSTRYSARLVRYHRNSPLYSGTSASNFTSMLITPRID